MNKPLKPARHPQPSPPGELRFDPISPFCRDVLALFAGAFSEVRFPDLDREVLQADASRLLVAQAEVEALEQQLDEARERTRQAGQTLISTATRAVAYARIFVSGQAPEVQEALEQALAAIQPPSEAKKPERAARPRRARPKNPTGELLAMGEDHSEAAE